MQLSDLLSELRQNILFDRSDRIAGSSDLLWSDATLIRYIDLAHKRFARRSLIIRDGTTPEVTQVTLRTGVKEYPLHQSVVAVMSARYAEGSDLHRAGHSAFDAYRAPDPFYFDVNNLNTIPAGKPQAFSTDEELSDDGDGRFQLCTLRLYPTPSADYDNVTLYLRVCRGPLDDFRPDDLQMQAEIPEEWQLEMLDYAAYRALSVVDRDAGDQAMAQAKLQSFNAAVDMARQEAMRKLFARQEWGFGRNGFRWDR